MDLSPVTYMDPFDLMHKVTDSVDSFAVKCVEGCEDPTWCKEISHFQTKFQMLMDQKFKECSESFISCLINEGARNPVVIEVSDEAGSDWRFGNGHHRMAVYLQYHLENLPVLFAFDGDYMQSGLSGSYDSSADDDWDC